MRYVALLRGINVGGKKKVEMARLRDTAEELGFTNVGTYINSGNLIFDHDGPSGELAEALEEAIAASLEVDTRVLLRSRDAVLATVAAIPAEWVNDKAMKCDVLFLWDSIDEPAVVERLPINPEIDNLIYAPGAVIWRVDRENQTRSRLSKLVGTDLYQSITVRNCNTVRRLAGLMMEE